MTWVVDSRKHIHSAAVLVEEAHRYLFLSQISDVADHYMDPSIDVFDMYDGSDEVKSNPVKLDLWELGRQVTSAALYLTSTEFDTKDITKDRHWLFLRKNRDVILTVFHQSEDFERDRSIEELKEFQSWQVIVGSSLLVYSCCFIAGFDYYELIFRICMLAFIIFSDVTHNA